MAFSPGLTPVQSEMFSTQFRVNFQAKGRLRKAVENVTDLVGTSWKDKVFDQMALQSIGLGAIDIPASTIDSEAPSMTPADYAAKLTISDREAARINASVINKYSMSLSLATERRIDQYIIDAFVAGVTQTVPASGANMTTTKFQDALADLGAHEINSEDQDVFCVMHVNQYAALSDDEKFTNAFYVNQKIDIKGYKGTYLGVNLIVMGDRSLEGGLPLAGNDRSCFMFARNSTNLGLWIPPRLAMEYDRTNFRTIVSACVSGGAVTSLSDGVVEIVCDESA